MLSVNNSPSVAEGGVRVGLDQVNLDIDARIKFGHTGQNFDSSCR